MLTFALSIDSAVTYNENSFHVISARPDVSLLDVPEGLTQWAAAAAAAAIGLSLGVQRALKSWAGNSRDIEKTHGEFDVVALLRTELERMAAQNDKLANLVNKLQAQVIELTSKNAKLNLEIQMLDFQVKGMRGLQGMEDQ